MLNMAKAPGLTVLREKEDADIIVISKALQRPD